MEAIPLNGQNKFIPPKGHPDCHSGHSYHFIESNHVYGIPLNANLTSEDGILRVGRPTQARDPWTPIDNFFRFLSEDQGPYAICIILSGTVSNGIISLRAVKK